MLSFRVKSLQNGFGSPTSASHSSSPNTDVGEIDTRAPFESVKAAVNLFGDAGSPRATPMTKKTKAEERKLLEKEAQYHMLLRELDYYKDQLKTTETTKDEALKDMKKANVTLVELTNKLETLSQAKQAAKMAAEASKTRAKELEKKKTEKTQLGNNAWKLNLDAEKELYNAISLKLIDSKQELTNLRQDYDAALEAKLSAFRNGEDCRKATNAKRETETSLFDEVSLIREKLDHVKSTSYIAEEKHLKLIAQKEVDLVFFKSAKENVDMGVKHLRQEYEPENDSIQKLEEVTEAIKGLEEDMINVYASDFDSLNDIVSELASTKNKLREVVSEENSVKSYVDSVKLELEEGKTRRYESNKKAGNAETKLELKQAELENKKAELEASKTSSFFEDMNSRLNKLLEEAFEKKKETECIIRDTESVIREAERIRISTKEDEEKLKLTLMEIREAKDAKKVANDHIRDSPKINDRKNRESSREIVLSNEEFKFMYEKIEDLKNEVDEEEMKLRIDTKNVRESDKEIRKKVDLVLEEIVKIELEIENVLERKKMDEEAKRIIEDELKKCSKF